MSGFVSGGKHVEPNLTPMLDMVFQLITFFMLVLNFKAAELDLTLMLPVIGSAKPVHQGEKTKLLVLNVQTAVKCPKCDALATLVRDVDENTHKVTGYHLKCERGHLTPCKEDATRNGVTALSVYNHLYAEKTDPSIRQYLVQEREQSRMAADPPLTVEDVTEKGKKLPDIVVIRADKECPFGAVNYIITECQRQGYLDFALKTGGQKN